MKIAWTVPCAAVGLALAVGLAGLRPASGGPDEEAPLLLKKCGAFVDAFNAHDAKGMAAGFALDGDVITPTGQRVSGREAIEKAYAEEHGPKGAMREAKLEVLEEPLRFPSADVAIGDAEVVVTGVIGPDGTKAPPVSLHVTNVWKKSGGEWWIYASRPYVKASAPPAAGAPPR